MPTALALNVSNFVTTEELPADTEFADVNVDPDNFRLQVNDGAAGESVTVTLEVIRGNTTIQSNEHVLRDRGGPNNAIYRGDVLRLVSDEVDQNANADDPQEHQVILVRLGDTVKMTYQPAAGAALSKQMNVGRPAGQGDNGTNQLRHDIRELKVHVVVFTDYSQAKPAVTKAQVQEDLDRANERLAQSTIRIAANSVIDMGPNGGGYIWETGPFDTGPIAVRQLNQDLEKAVAKMDNDPNSIDIFYVQGMLSGDPGEAFSRYRNRTNNPNAQNFIILRGRARKPFTLPHEIMHILLDSAHRFNEPKTALFNAPTSPQNSVDATKRIGPNPAATTANVGKGDTSAMRGTTNTLP